MIRLAPAFALVLALFAANAAKADPAAPPSLGFHPAPCGADYTGLAERVDCGTMVVEETRGSHNGRVVELPVVIARATAADKKPDPVIFLHGGPGGGVVDGLFYRLRRPDGVTHDRDWIFFDQRGTGLAKPSLDCGVAPLSDAGVTSDAGVAILQACGKRLQAQGIDLSQYNSAVIVKDIRDLRQALGITTYNIYSGSYGTRVAMAVMQHDPADLRAAVLSSTWPPEASATGPLGIYVSNNVRKVLRYCAQDSVCNAKFPNIEARLDARMTEWLKTPVILDGNTYTADEMGAYLLDEIYGDEGARRLPSTIDKVLKGNYHVMDNFIKYQAGYSEGQFFTTLCSEQFPFESPDKVDDGGGKDPIAAAVARDAKRFFPVCDAFPTGKPDPVEHQPLTSDIPILMLSADIDAGCPAELSEVAVKRLSHAKNYFFPNRMHTIQGSDCSRKMIAEFLETANPNVNADCIKTDRPSFPFIYDDK